MQNRYEFVKGLAQMICFNTWLGSFLSLRRTESCTVGTTPGIFDKLSQAESWHKNRIKLNVGGQLDVYSDLATILIEMLARWHVSSVAKAKGK